MIEITDKPPSIPTFGTATKAPPVPVSECWKFCLQADVSDGIGTPGSQATVVVVFPLVTTVPADGAMFKIWGNDFTVDSSQDFTSDSFKVTTSGIVASINFGNMILANYYFNKAVSIASAVVGATIEVTLTWNECREQTGFSEEQMDFTAIEATGGSGSFENGVSPVYVDGYKIITRLGYYTDATSVFNPISVFVGLQANLLCSTVGQVCPEYVDSAQLKLYTELPDLTIDSFIPSIQLGRSVMRLFSLEYGWTFRENCIAKSGTIKKSEIVLGINAAFELDDPFQMRRYWYGHPDGYPDGQFVSEFLTTQPKSIPLCWDSFKWLWLLNSWQQDFGTYRLVARFGVYNKNGTTENFDFIINDPATDGHSWYQPVNFNVSPGFVLENTPTFTEGNIAFYDVVVIGTDTEGEVLFNATEILRFRPDHCCEGNTDIYFLTPAGGIGTVLAKIDKKEVVREGTEINLQSDCSGSRTTQAKYGGRSLRSLRSYERISFTIDAPKTMEWQRWMKHLQKSPQHWIRVSDEAGSNLNLGGDPLAKKMILDPGSVTIYQSGQGIQFSATGYLTDIPTQKGIEPL